MYNVYPFKEDTKSDQKISKSIGFSKVYLTAKTTPPVALLPASTQTESEIKKDIVWSVLAYIFFPISLFFGPRGNEFVAFHTRQSFGIFVASLAVYIIEAWLGLYLLAVVLNIALFAIWCIGISYVFSGKTKRLPVVGNLSEKYRIF